MVTFWRTAVVALLAAALTAGGTGAAAVSPWRKAAPLEQGRAAHAVVTDGRAIFALGGTGANAAPVLQVERFDGTRWRPETRLPGGGLNAPAAAVVRGRIYVIGGFGHNSNVPVATTRVYDIATKRWTLAARLPAARGGHAAVVLNGRIHVLGGGNDRQTLALHSVYDPETDAWSELAPLPRAKGSVAAVVHRGRIYAIGGRSGSSDFGDVDVYDPTTNRWSRGRSIGPRGTAGAASYRGAIYVFGGESQASASTLAAVLRLTPSGWKRVATMPTARSYPRAVVFRDAVYVVGGSRYAGAAHASAGSRIVDRYFVAR